MEKRIILDEKNFTKLVVDGFLDIEGITLNYNEMVKSGNMKTICTGGVGQVIGAKIILKDIGYDRIARILKLKNNG